MGIMLNRVFSIIKESDVILEVLDSRFPRFSKRLEKLVKKKKKKLVTIFSKIDLVEEPTKLKELKEDYRAILFSSKTRKGKRELLRLLYKLSKNKETEGDLRVGVVGLPNVGKSSLINALRGRKVARVSAQAGFTKGKQWIRLAPTIVLIDSPGVITWEESEEDLIIRDSLDIDRAEDPIKVALQLLDEHAELIGPLGISSPDENGINEFAIKTGKLKRGGKPNTKEAAKMIIRRWQRGKLKEKIK